jgi:hypothetical protein
MELYGHLAARTFEIRTKKYLAQVSGNSEFTYDKKTFKISGHVIDGRKIVDIFKAKTLRRPFTLLLWAAPSASFVDKMKQRILLADIRISTLYDQDVFYALLAKLYNVSCKN